jgi:thiamine biosynthesis lipoprotein
LSFRRKPGSKRSIALSSCGTGCPRIAMQDRLLKSGMTGCASLAARLIMTIAPQRLLLATLLVSLMLFSSAGCGMQKEVLLSGRTMGTFYHIKVVTSYFEDLSGLQTRIDARLEEINQSMSTYRPDSEISRYNRLPAAETMAVSADFGAVLKVAKTIHRLSGGAWDGTIKPLVNLWGFGNARPVVAAPDKLEIAKHLANIGFEHIRFLDDGRIGKQIPGLTLDLASIAKGFGVDAVAAVIHKAGYPDFLVEIGGEIVASGVRKDGLPWVVGINRPVPEATANAVYRAVSLTRGAMATSGDYRIFFELDGIRYAHVIDPRTGYPVQNRAASVTVVAPDCTLADGLATALMVMGVKDGLALINRLQKVECLIIVPAPNGQFSHYTSAGFPK